MKREKIVELFKRLQSLDPNPTTELHYKTPFELLVAVILSAQATDVGVNKATKKLFPVARTPKAMLDLGEEGLFAHLGQHAPVPVDPPGQRIGPRATASARALPGFTAE